LSLLPPRQEALASVVSEVSTFESYDIQELLQIVSKYMEKESVLIRSTFGYQTAGPSSKTRLAKSQLQPLFRALGVHARKKAIEEACQMAFIPKEAKIALKDFIRILAAYRAREGTTAADLEEAIVVFNSFAVCGEAPEEKPSLSQEEQERSLARQTESCKGKMRLRELLDAAVKLLGIELQPILRDLLLKLPSEAMDGNSPGRSKEVWLSLGDFLVWMRRVREANLASLWKVFRKADQSSKGSISPEQLIRAMPELQYTLMPASVKSFLKTIGVPPGKMLPFDDFVNFVKVVRQTQGFSVSEVQEMEVLFRQFDYDHSRTIEGPELLDILAHLGHPTSVEEVHSLFTALDVDRNGSLDMDEFLRFMRIHREAEVKHAQAQFEKEQGEADNRLMVVGEEMVSAPSIAEMTKMTSQYSFDKFWSILQAGRKAAAEETRHHAGFSNAEVHEVQEAFNRHGGSDGYIDQAGLIRVLGELHVAMRSCAERDAVFRQLEVAYQESIRAERAAVALDGRSSLSTEVLHEPAASATLDAQHISFETLLYFLRTSIREATRTARLRELEAVQQCAFEPQEVSELRNTFTKAVQEANESRKQRDKDRRPSELGEKRYTIAAPGDVPDGRASLAGTRRRSAANEPVYHEPGPVQEEEDILTRGVFPKLDIGSVYMLLRNMGLRLTQQDRVHLIVKATEICKNSHGHDGKDEEDAESDLESDNEEEEVASDSRLDFANFLLLMSWIVQTDFAEFHLLAGPEAEDMTSMKSAKFSRRVVGGAQHAGKSVVSRKTVAFSS